jgi:hypothetical protein
LSKKTLGPRRLVATADTTGNNAGKYTCVFTPAVMSVKWTQYEVYKMVVNIPTANGVVGWKIFIGIHQYEGFQSLGQATWSDSQSMVIDSGENLYFYFDNLVATAAPTVTLWIQVDMDIARIQK